MSKGPRTKTLGGDTSQGQKDEGETQRPCYHCNRVGAMVVAMGDDGACNPGLARNLRPCTYMCTYSQHIP
jgi:hypothetical protein